VGAKLGERRFEEFLAFYELEPSAKAPAALVALSRHHEFDGIDPVLLTP
jgi:hypothetical protein